MRVSCWEIRTFTDVTLQALVSSLRSVIGDEKLHPGLTVGLEFGPDMWRWFDIYLWVKRPGGFLCYEIETGNVAQWIEAFGPLGGDLRVLKKLKLDIPNLF